MASDGRTPSPLPYTLVEVDEPKRSPREAIAKADRLQWMLWVQRYAWVLALVTMAPGLMLALWLLTGNLPLAVGLVAVAVTVPVFVSLSRTRGLP